MLFLIILIAILVWLSLAIIERLTRNRVNRRNEEKLRQILSVMNSCVGNEMVSAEEYNSTIPEPPEPALVVVEAPKKRQIKKQIIQ